MDNDILNNLTPEQIAAILEENARLKEENKTVKKENSSLKQKNTKKDKKLKVKDDIIKQQSEELDATKGELREAMRKLQKALKKIETKTHIIKLNNHNKFYSTKEDNKEPVVINEAEEHAKKKCGRPKGSKNFESLDLESLTSKTIINDSVSICDNCGATMNKIRDDVSYKIEVKPAEYLVTKIITPIYSCKKCGKLVEALSTSVFNHSACTPSLAANIINAKYDIGVPLYRYSKYLNDRNIPLSTMTLSNYVLATDELLKPLYDLLYKSLVNCSSKVIHVDETPLEVLDFAKEGKKNGYIFAYVSSYYDNPIYIYSFNKTRETEETKMLLKGYKGYLVCDGYAAYNDVASDNVKIQRCLVHVRRYFYDIVKTTPSKLLKGSVAMEMVNKIDKLFHEEARFSELKLGPEAIFERRHSEGYQLLVNDMYEYLHSINAEVGTPLAKAVNYFLKVEEETKTFLLDGHVPLSNNICERAIKPFTILRRNFLFSKNVKGANGSARLFSLIQTAKANGLVPEAYLNYAINSIGKIPLEDLLPWSNKIPSSIKSLNQ